MFVLKLTRFGELVSLRKLSSLPKEQKNKPAVHEIPPLLQLHFRNNKSQIKKMTRSNKSFFSPNFKSFQQMRFLLPSADSC